MANKVNYHHARKQKEQARKARQQEKQQRRAERPPELAAGENAEQTASTPGVPVATAGNGVP